MRDMSTMPASEKRKIWIVIDHPMQFATALALASYRGQEKFVPRNSITSEIIRVENILVFHTKVASNCPTPLLLCGLGSHFSG